MYSQFMMHSQEKNIKLNLTITQFTLYQSSVFTKCVMLIVESLLTNT